MAKEDYQSSLFDNPNIVSNNINLKDELLITKIQLESWQKRIHLYQKKLFNKSTNNSIQNSFFSTKGDRDTKELNLLALTPLPINFWRWSNSPHEGPAIYLVTDKPSHLNSYILLYIGETKSANLRWKGEHDCKKYLNSYLESLNKVGLSSQLAIRFWCDVPATKGPRQLLERSLIQKWLPPFNKETRYKWSTPFTSNQLS